MSGDKDLEGPDRLFTQYLLQLTGGTAVHLADIAANAMTRLQKVGDSVEFIWRRGVHIALPGEKSFAPGVNAKGTLTDPGSSSRGPTPARRHVRRARKKTKRRK